MEYKIVQIKLKPEEKETIKSAAAFLGLTVSSLIRSSSLEKARFTLKAEVHQ